MTPPKTTGHTGTWPSPTPSIRTGIATPAIDSQSPAARRLAAIEQALLSRWPETKLEPTLDRIHALAAALSNPQRAYPVIHLTGTNGKTTTSRMIDTLLCTLGLRTGRFTSPHIHKISERISINEQPLSDQAFLATFERIAPLLRQVDSCSAQPLSFFETVVGMAYAAFAEHPVDAAVIEVGMGGSWDATNITDGAVAVVLPVAMDHVDYLGDSPVMIAREKAGIIKTGSTAILAAQSDEVRDVLFERAMQVGATVLCENVDFAVLSRTPERGGQIVSLQVGSDIYDDVFLSLHGTHNAQNAVVALTAVTAFCSHPVPYAVVRSAFSRFTSPGRLEPVSSSPPILLDAAHNPHGAAAAAAALKDSFAYSPLVGVIAVMGDKDVRGILRAFEPHMQLLVATENSQQRSMRAPQLGSLAGEIFGQERVIVIDSLDKAITRAIDLVSEGSATTATPGAVIITGSVVTIAEARAILATDPPAHPRAWQSPS